MVGSTVETLGLVRRVQAAVQVSNISIDLDVSSDPVKMCSGWIDLWLWRRMKHS
jgi:hypothetical protein